MGLRTSLALIAGAATILSALFKGMAEHRRHTAPAAQNLAVD